MTIINAVKKFVLKEDFDFDQPNLTLQIFHPQIEMCFALNGIFFNNRDSKVRFVWPVLSMLISMIAASFEMMFIWRGVVTEDYGFATECFCYLIIIVMVCVVYSTMLFNKDLIFQLIENLNNDFLYICNINSKYRDTFLNGQLLIWKICWSWISFSTFICVLYISNTLLLLLYHCTLLTEDEHQVRPLVFPMWLPEDDPYRTPNYEVFMFFQILLIFIVLVSFCLYVYLLFHLLLHAYFLMDIILMAFDELFDDLDATVISLPQHHHRRREVQAELNWRIGRIVRWHNSIFNIMANISSMFGPTLVYQVMLSSVVICLIAYQVAEELSRGKFDYLFAALGVAACLQLWIPCYIGTLLRDKAFSLGDQCFYCGWHETALARLIRQELIFFILRTQKPAIIKFTALPHVQLETFSSIMSTAYSYFNMLRQYK